MELRIISLNRGTEHVGKMAALATRSDQVGWTLTKFRDFLETDRIHAFGAVDAKKDLFGYLICDATKTKRVAIVALVVDPAHRRRGIGTRLLTHLTDKMRKVGETSRLVAAIPETNYEGAKFLANFGKESEMSLRTNLQKNRSGGVDDYLFVFQDKEKEACVP